MYAPGRKWSHPQIPSSQRHARGEHETRPDTQLSTCLVKTATAKNTDQLCMLPGEVLGRVLLEQKVYVRIPKLTTCSLQVQQFLLTFRP